MSHFDMDMMALFGLLLLLGGVTLTFLKEMIILMVGLFLFLILVWGDDICSREERLRFYGDHFDRGGEIICKDDNGHPLLISESKGWERKGAYLFKGSRGVEILEDQCEILDQDEPHCISVTTQIIIGTTLSIGIFGWIIWMFMRMRSVTIKELKPEAKAGGEEKEKIEKKAGEIAEHHRADPEFKEYKDREIRERAHEDDDDTNR
jgi:hypothetical protein